MELVEKLVLLAVSLPLLKMLWVRARDQDRKREYFDRMRAPKWPAEEEGA